MTDHGFQIKTKFKFKGITLEIGERWVYTSFLGPGSELIEIIERGKLESENSYYPVVKCIQIIIPYWTASIVGECWECVNLGQGTHWTKLENQHRPSIDEN